MKISRINFGPPETRAEAYHVSDPRLPYMLNIGGRSAGVVVNEQTALTLSAVWAAIGIKSETLASLPFGAYQKDKADPRKRRLLEAHPVTQLLHVKPNNYQTCMAFVEVLEAHRNTSGNGYAEIERANNGTPIALHPLYPGRVKPRWSPAANAVVYDVSKAGGGLDPVPANDMFHVYGMGFDGLQGYSPVDMFRRTLGLGISSEESAASLMENDATPNGIIKHPSRLGKGAQDTLRADWKEIHGGPSKRGEIAVLEEGMEFQQISLKPEDLQLIATRNLTVKDVARIWRVPLHMLAELSDSTLANIEQQSIEFVTYTVRTPAIRWQQECDRKLILPRDRPGIYTKIKIDALLAGDFKTRQEGYAVGRQWGWYSANDICELEDRDPIPAEQGGDVYLIPLNYQTGADVVAPKTPAADTSTQTPPALPIVTEPAKRMLDLLPSIERRELTDRAGPPTKRALAETLARLARREHEAVKKLAKKPEEFRDALGPFYTEHQAKLAEAIAAPYSAYAALYDVQQTAEAYAAEHCNRARQALEAIEATSDKLPQAVNAELGQWAQAADTIETRL